MKRPQAGSRKSSPARRAELDDYVRRILGACVYDVARETPLEQAPRLSHRLDNLVLLKREDTQPVFSFKLRGAYNRMARLTAAELRRGVICASAGNHAQGVALAASRLGCSATIVMPATTPRIKVEAVRALGAKVLLEGESYSDAQGHALALGARRRLTFVHPFDDPDVIAGQGTVAMEILRQRTASIEAIFAPVGGGGLISGVAAYVKAIRPEIRVIGVQTHDSDAMLRSVKAGKRVRLRDVGLFSDGTAVKLVGRETFRLCRHLVDDYVVVDTDAVCAAIKDVFEDTRSMLEPAGALAVAALKQYASERRVRDRTLVAITSGANTNFDRLRFVAERAEFGEEREALFAVTIREERGSFRRLCATVGARAVTEFNYRISGKTAAHVFIGLAISSREESRLLARRFERSGFPTTELSRDELAKQHVRHMVGGRTGLAAGERVFRFTFPERPGALMTFLSNLPPSSNISLFHYRNQGTDHAQVLVGIQVAEADRGALRAFLAAFDHGCVEETENPCYDQFLRWREG